MSNCLNILKYKKLIKKVYFKIYKNVETALWDIHVINW